MPFRQLPATDSTRLNALRQAHQKAHNLQESEVLAFSQNSLASLRDLFPRFQEEMDERSAAQATQSEASKASAAATQILRMQVSHFLQVFNLGVERGKYPEAHRAHFGIDVSSSSLPDLSTQNALLTVARNLVEGDPRRLAAGGAPMENPNAAEVAASREAYEQALQHQAQTSGTLDREQEDVEKLRASVDSLIRDIWDEVEFAFRRDDPPSLRRKARAYGVHYASRPGEPAEADEPATV